MSVTVFRGQAALSAWRDGVPSGHFNTPSLVLARVIDINYAERTLTCIGLNGQQSIPWFNVPVTGSAWTQSEGEHWLPIIDSPIGDADHTRAKLDGIRDAVAIIAFIENNPNLPMCLGFMAPGPNELSFDEPGTKLFRHNSNVYERLTSTGLYEFVFPDKTFISVSGKDESEQITNLQSKNIDSLYPWAIGYDKDRKILLSHSSGNKLRISSDGIDLEAFSISGTDETTGVASYKKTSSLTLNPSSLLVTGNVVINGSSLYDLTQAQINSSISTLFSTGSLPGTSGSISVNLNMSGSGLYDNSISISKLNFDVATQAELNAINTSLLTSIASVQSSVTTVSGNLTTLSTAYSTHAADGSIHFQLGTTSTTASRGDHTHELLYPSGSLTYGVQADMIVITGTTNYAGTGSINKVLRADHAHGISITSLSAAPADITIGASTSVGATTSYFARSDHVHKTPSTWTPTAHTHFPTDLQATAGTLTISSTTLALTGTNVAITGALLINGSSLNTFIRAQQDIRTYLLYATTTNATPQYMTTTGGTTLSSTNHMVIEPNQVWTFKLEITANLQSGAYGGTWVVQGAVRKGSTYASTEFIGIPNAQAYADSIFSGANISVDVEKINFGSIVVTVTGLAGNTIYWKCTSQVSGSADSSSAYPSVPSNNQLSTSATTADFGTYILKCSTVGVSSARLTMDDFATATADNTPILPNSSAWMVSINIAANIAGTSAGMWYLSGIYRRGIGASTISFLGPLRQEEMMDPVLENAMVDISADIILGGVNLTVTGITGNTVNWVAVMETTEMQ